MITNEAVSKSIGRVLSAKRDGNAMASSKATTTMNAIRGHIMAVALLLGNATVDGEPKTFAGERARMAGGVVDRGWDPLVDGGAAPELVAFLRRVFDVRLAARSLALKIQSAAADLRRRMPVPLLSRVHVLVANGGPRLGESTLVGAGGEVSGMGPYAADTLVDVDDAELDGGGVHEDNDATAASSSTCSGSDVFSSDEDDGVDLPRQSKKPIKVVWERHAPLLSYGEALEEPALAATGGGDGADRLQNLSLLLLSHIPSTAASSLKIMELVCAIVVDTTIVWAPQGSWGAVDAVVAVLRMPDFSIGSFANVLRLPAVKEQRLLRGAVACLGPGLEAHHTLRVLLADVVAGQKPRVVEYGKWVQDGGDADALDAGATEALRAEMAAAHPAHTFFHKHYTDGWLRPPASVAAYRSVYSEHADQSDDYLKTGMWAPRLPVLRPMPGFAGTATPETDLPTCSHEMGKENSHTGGTVGAFCTCAHPKCVAVMVLTGSESQLMPLEFVA